jgi:hypothetical protein
MKQQELGGYLIKMVLYLESKLRTLHQKCASISTTLNYWTGWGRLVTYKVIQRSTFVECVTLYL